MPIRDSEYLYATTRVRSLERSLLNRERMERMIEAKTREEALKQLVECGFALVSGQTLEQNLTAERTRTFDLITSIVPDPRLVDFFRIKYDYHNVKTLLKSEVTGFTKTPELLSDAGRIGARAVTEIIRAMDYAGLPILMRNPVAEARELLARAGDPQQADFLLDRACFAEMQALARATGSAFLEGYVSLLVDTANLRALVRAQRIGRGPDYLRLVLMPGGHTDASRFLAVMAGTASPEEMFSHTPLEAAAVAAVPAMRNETSLTQFELLCDNAAVSYLRAAKYAPFGEQPAVAYLAAREADITAVRIIMSGRDGGVAPARIRERLRDVYV